jgi:hypothetical protein
MLTVGSFVKFVWWSEYKAPSITLNELGRVSWHEVHPGDTGIVICSNDDEYVVVLFSGVDTLLKIHRSMLEAI